MPGSQYPLFSCRPSLPSHCAEGSLSAGAHTSGLYVAFHLVWTLGAIKWQNARAARDPNPGPSHPTLSFATVVPLIRGEHLHDKFDSMAALRQPWP